MRDEKIAILVLSSVFFVILLTFRKLVKYPFCDLEQYAGKSFAGRPRGGKSGYFLIFHLIASLGLTLLSFYFLSNIGNLDDYFDNTLIRLGTIVIIWSCWALGIGWFIELYLERTDEEYKQWKGTK